MKYFEIETCPSEDSDLAFIDRPPEGTRPYKFMMTKGIRIGAKYPADAKVYLQEKSPGTVLPSLIGNIYSFLIVHRSLKEVLETAKVELECLPFTLYNHKKRVASRDYFIVNPIGTFDCIDEKETKIRYAKAAPSVIIAVDKLVLDPKKLAKAPDLFRIDRQPSHYVISARLGKKLAALKPTNFYIHELAQSSAGK